jgi:hypothetical protein
MKLACWVKWLQTRVWMQFQIVVRGLVARIHVFIMLQNKAWMAGNSPARTFEGCIKKSSDGFWARKSQPDSR